MTEETKIYHVDERYKMIIERAASSTKGVDGFKVEANGDQMDLVRIEAETMYKWAKDITATTEDK